MKKILKNKKGFTLVELLAVIVVLAIIMVIATTQINGIIKKNRVDAFLSTYKVAMNAAKTCAVQQISESNCVESVDYSTDDYTLSITSSDYTNYEIVLTAKAGGQFENIEITSYYANNDTGKNALKKQLGAQTKLTINSLSNTSLNATYKID